MANRDFNMAGFTRINIHWAMEIEVSRGENYSVVVSGTETQLKNIDAHLEGDCLNVRYNLNLVSFLAAPFARMSVRITLPELRELNIAGAATGRVYGFHSDNDFALYLSGASRLDLSDMSVGTMKWDLSGASRVSAEIKAAGDVRIRDSGASRVDLKGFGKDMDLDATGASHIEAADFEVHNAKVRFAGASKGSLNLNGSLDAALDGASHLDFRGQATLGETRISGASSLQRR
jgi:hypothetical protein